MAEILTIGKTILEAGASAALVGLLLILAIPSLKKKFFGNGEGARFDAIDQEIAKLGGNHLAHAEMAIKENTKAIIELREKIIDLQEEENKILTELLIAVKTK